MSRRIRQLESALDAALFDRRGPRLALSAAGRALLPHAERVLAAARDAREAVEHATGSASETRLRLAIVGTLADSHLAHAVRAFEREYPATKVTVATATSREVSALVRSGDADLGLRYFADPDGDLVSTQVGSERLRLIVPAEHHLRRKRLRSLAPLAGERWLGFPPERGQSESWGHLVARIVSSAGASSDALTIVDSLTAQKRLVQAGMGIALMPMSAVREEVRLGSLRAIELQGHSVVHPVVAVRRAHAFETGAAEAFVRRLRVSMSSEP